MSDVVVFATDGDGEKRITKNGDFTAVGGTKETHEKLQEMSIKFNESLKGKRVRDLPPEKVIDLMFKAAED